MEHGSALLETWTVALFAAVALQILASRLRLPAIVLLLLGGILLGPEVLGLVHPDALGDGLTTVISLAVAVILFEGGLTLEVGGFGLAPSVIRRMLTVGVAITWITTAVAILLLYDYSVSFAALAASLTIVTGPTVIGPILRRVQVKKRIHQILHWESVLIDPIGVFIALGCFEWLYFEASLSPVLSFLGRLAVGALVGLAAGQVLSWVLRHEWIDQSFDNLFFFTAALVIFGVCDLFLAESGLLAVTVAGLVLGRSKSQRLKAIKSFKLDVTKLAIGVLFVLLAARLDLGLFTRLGWQGILLLLLIMFVIRPLNVLASSLGTSLERGERLFLSALAPRGIVAAAMASLFTLRLSGQPEMAEQAWFLEVFTYAVIGATVVIQGISAPVNARIMGVAAPPRRTWLIVGARAMGQAIARALGSAGVPALVVDINAANVRRAEERGIQVHQENILDESLLDDGRFIGVGAVLCATGNPALDELACQRWADVVAPGRLYRLSGLLQDDERSDAESPTTGRPIWQNLVPLANLEHEIETGDTVLRRLRISPNLTLGDGLWPLFVLDGDSVRLIAEFAPGEELAGGEVIAVDRRRTQVASLIRSMVSFEDERPNREEVIGRLLEEATRFQPDIDRDRLLRELLERESTMPSYIGHGVAIPHAYCGGAGEPVCVVGRLEHGMAPETFDGEPIRIVFLLISPAGKAELHLRSLGRLARIASSRELVDEVLAVATESEGLSLMHSYHTVLQTRAEVDAELETVGMGPT